MPQQWRAFTLAQSRLKTLEILRRPGTYERLDRLSQIVAEGWLAEAKVLGIPACVNRVGSMFTLFFQDGPVTDYTSAKRSDLQRFGAFFRGMRARGVSLPPSQYEAAFLSAAHTEADVDATVAAADEALAASA